MLTLRRKDGERVRLELPDGRHIWIKVLKDRIGRLRMGIDAPRDVKIAREELLPAEEQYADG